MTHLNTILKKTLEDKKFSRSEKKALSEIIEEHSPDERELQMLRKESFTIALSEISGIENRKIVEWLEDVSKLFLKKEDDIITNVYFSPDQDCAQKIISSIKTARKSLDICVYTISDDRISKEIVDIYKKGVAVRIISDNDKSYDLGSDISYFHKSGLYVRIDDTTAHMHHKFAVIDKKTTITGSYNWTRSANNYNQENVLITDDRKVAAKYITEFERLWEKMKDY